uniref:Uncharacterized protein n=1 Tax=Aegilops tauschii subsp. strangulata TaxID=200361 RepID=A0A453MHQ9_AEGTS
MARNRSLKSPDLTKSVNNSMNISAGDTASLIYLWNPWTIITCVGSCTSPIENLMVVIMLHGACSRLPPLAAFGYVMATHLSLYPAILILPIPLQLKYFYKKAQVPIKLTFQIMEKVLSKKDLDNSHGNQYSTSYCWSLSGHVMCCY